MAASVRCYRFDIQTCLIDEEKRAIVPCLESPYQNYLVVSVLARMIFFKLIDGHQLCNFYRFIVNAYAIFFLNFV